MSGSVVGDFLARLAIALPLVSALAVLAVLALRRWGGGTWALRAARPRARSAARLTVEASAVLGPAARVALVRMGPRRLLLGVTGGSVVLLAEEKAGDPTSAPADADADAGAVGLP